MKKYVNTILSVMLLVSMAFGMFGCSEKSGVVDPEMYDKAVSAMESGNYEEAYDLFIKLDPDYQDVKEYLSHFYFVPVSGSMEYFSYGERVVQSATEISYNEYGLPILIVEKNTSGAENWAHTYEYDDKGRVVYEAYEKRGQFYYDIKYTYNELDQLVKIIKKLAGSPVTITENTYDEKGNMLIHEVLPILKGIEGLNFVGNIEGRDIMNGKQDVVVCDGFSGNIALKSIEGAAVSVMKLLKEGIYSSLSSKIGGLFLKKTFKKLKGKLDYQNKGGALFIGVNKPVIKAHGSSNASAFKNAVLQAVGFAGFNISDKITEKLALYKPEGEV